MGIRDSKLGLLSFDDAIKQVKEDDLKRLRDVFKRYGPNGTISKPAFIREVLTDGVPIKLSERIFTACGGTSKGLNFKELLCFLVVFTSGTPELRMRLLYAIFSPENSPITRRDVETVILMCDPQIPSCVNELFENHEHVDLEEFAKWAKIHMSKMSVTQWFLGEKQGTRPRLSDEHDPPTFYQTLAKITKLKEEEVMAMEKAYYHIKTSFKSGKFDVDAFVSHTSPPLPERLSKALYQAMDTNSDNHLDMKEVACAVSLLCRGTPAEQQRFIFKIFDQDHDSLLNDAELESMVEMLADVHLVCKAESVKNEQEAMVSVKDEIHRHLLSSINNGSQSEVVVSLDDYVKWAESASWPADLGYLLYQVCHVLLGLLPATPADEGRVIHGWMKRDKKLGRPKGSTWYLLSTVWWKSWCEYVKGNPLPDSAVSTSLPDHPQTSLPSSPVKTSPTLPQDVSATSRGGLRRRGSNSFPVTGSQGLGAMDNTVLCAPEPRKTMVMVTNEGGTLRRGLLVEGKDFELLSEPVWKVLVAWHGGGPALPRSMVDHGHGDIDIDLHLVTIRFYRHTTTTPRNTSGGPLAHIGSAWSWFLGGTGGSSSAAAGAYSSSGVSPSIGQPPLPRRYLGYHGAYSRHKTIGELQESLVARLFLKAEDLRLWELKADGSTVLLDDEKVDLRSFNFEQSSIIIDIRNKDLTWPEEMCNIAAAAKSKEKERKKSTGPMQKGTTGLSNLGNTCFMNSAVQCISNTQPLTIYFSSFFHLDELNRTNPLGWKGHLAKRYGDLVLDLWSGTSKSIAPLRLRLTIAKYAPRFNGFQQQDSQELLAFLLDGLHEDLNRITDKPYVELRDSDGRPDAEVAKEAWDNHLKRNKSVVVELFHGQLKSHVRCLECGHSNVRFDPFTFLSLPLPMENTVYLEVTVVRLDGSVPVRYALRLDPDTRYSMLKVEVGKLCGISASELVVVELFNSRVHNVMMDSQKICTVLGGCLYAYEIPSLPIEPVKRSESMEHLARHERLFSKENSVKSVTSSDGSNGEVEKMRSTLQTPGEMRTHGEATAANGPVQDVQRQPQAAAAPASGYSAAFRLSTSPLPRSVYDGFVVALHRKTYMTDQYFITASKARPVVFGIPIIVPCLRTTPHRDLYASVMSQLKRFVSAPDPDLSSPDVGEFPFTLKAVSKDGLVCANCPWWRLCTGCTIACDGEPFNDLTAYLAIEWDTTTLHLRYQPGQEKLVDDDASIEKCSQSQTDPIDLMECLKVFTKEEKLGEDELWYCGKCKKHQLAAKKLDIWRLPPILIVHLKRFQFVNGQWVKSMKKVKFPMTNFTLSDMVVDQPPCNKVVEELGGSVAKRHEQAASESYNSEQAEVGMEVDSDQERQADLNGKATGGDVRLLTNGELLDGEGAVCNDSEERHTPESMNSPRNCVDEVVDNSPASIESGSLSKQSSRHQSVREPAAIDPLTREMVLEAVRQADIQNGVQPAEDEEKQRKRTYDKGEAESKGISSKTGLARTMAERLGTHGQDGGETTYNLYSMTIHSGMMGGGHYVSFACNPDGNWYLYNDSTCKKIEAETLTDESPYLLFYERSDINYHSFLPVKRPNHRADYGDDDEIENTMRKICAIM